MTVMGSASGGFCMSAHSAALLFPSLPCPLSDPARWGGGRGWWQLAGTHSVTCTGPGTFGLMLFKAAPTVGVAATDEVQGSQRPGSLPTIPHAGFKRPPMHSCPGVLVSRLFCLQTSN